MISDLHPLFYPGSIAIVGASPNMGYGNGMLKNLLRCKFPGAIYPVNPGYAAVEGLPCYRSLDDVPAERVDYAILAVRNDLVPGTLEQCARKGVRAANIIASGYGEITRDESLGARRQAELQAFVARTGVRIVGPNCLGIISTPASMAASSYDFDTLLPGKVALVLQSGMLLSTLVNTMNDRGIGFTYVVTSGNEADLNATDYLRYYVEDPQTRVIGAFLEQIRNPEGFVAVAERAAELRKPIVVVKVGRTEAGRRAARAHTGSLAGADEVIDAVMRRHGIIRAHTLEEFIETLCLCHAPTLPPTDGVAALMTSGGATGLVSDLGHLMGLRFPPLGAEGAARMQRVMPEYGAVGNPLDYTGQAWMQPEIIETALDCLAAEPDIGMIAYLRERPGNSDRADRVTQALEAMMAKYPAKVFFVMAAVPGAHKESLYPGRPPAQPTAYLGDIPHLQGMENSLRAMRSLVQYAQFQRARPARGTSGAEEGSADAARQAAARDLLRAGQGQPLTEAAGKQILSLYGIPVTKERVAASAAEAARHADSIGYPVALKIVSPQIAHKTEAGGVALNVRNGDEARAAFERIVRSARQYDPNADVQGVLVQEMVAGGHELIVGMTRDAQFGPAIVVGMGGILVEVLKDTVLRMPPLSEHDAREMIDALKGAAILKGARGARPADLGALVEVLLNFSQLCLDLRDDAGEIDINPLVVLPQGRGAKAVDCLIVRRTG